MLISEVETSLGLTKKSIRYYESVGLLTPKRGTQNDYRLYTSEDIEKLKKIKFLRELDVPIEDIKKLFNGSLTLYDCMLDRLNKIERINANLQKIESMCETLKNSNENINELNIDEFVKLMNVLNKEGFTMKKGTDIKVKKMLGAIISGTLFALFFIVMLSLITYFEFTEDIKIPIVVYLILMLLLLTPVISIIINIIERIKEIKGGEEDEASKY